MFVFVGDHMNAEGKLVDIRSLAAKIEDANFRIWDTTVESRLWIRLVEVSRAPLRKGDFSGGKGMIDRKSGV